MGNEKDRVLAELRGIPGVGRVLSEMLYNVGVRGLEDLKGADAEELFEWVCDYSGGRVDRCVLYVLRCGVYFASNDDHEPEKLNWWYWKD